MTSKSLVRTAVAAVLHTSGLLNLHRRLFFRDRAVVLMYHRVLQSEEVRSDLDAGMYVSISAFERHLKHLMHVFELVDLDGILAWLDGHTTFARPPCAITFDDGWRDVYRNAFPLLRRFNVPATIFIITEQIGTADMLTWDQVHEMETSGVRFASHTATHSVLTTLGTDQLERELAESKRQLEGHVSRPSAWFCYPKGLYDQRARDMASKYYAAAVTTRRALVCRATDRFQIPRIGVHQDIASTTALFALRLSTLR